MDMMELRRMVMAQMAGAKVKTGTFTGDGTRDAVLNIGFEPDVVIVDSNHKYNVAGLTGILAVILIKGLIVTNICHQNDTVTNAPMYGNPIGEGQNEWGSDSTTMYVSFATYANGVLTISNVSNGATNKFANGHQFTWTAYKK